MHKISVLCGTEIAHFSAIRSAKCTLFFRVHYLILFLHSCIIDDHLNGFKTQNVYVDEHPNTGANICWQAKAVRCACMCVRMHVCV